MNDFRIFTTTAENIDLRDFPILLDAVRLDSMDCGTMRFRGGDGVGRISCVHHALSMP